MFLNRVNSFVLHVPLLFTDAHARCHCSSILGSAQPHAPLSDSGTLRGLLPCSVQFGVALHSVSLLCTLCVCVYACLHADTSNSLQGRNDLVQDYRVPRNQVPGMNRSNPCGKISHFQWTWLLRHV